MMRNVMKKVTLSELTVNPCGVASITTTGITLVVDDNGCLSAEIE